MTSPGAIQGAEHTLALDHFFQSRFAIACNITSCTFIARSIAAFG
jgi:hypothetical protein